MIKSKRIVILVCMLFVIIIFGLIFAHNFHANRKILSVVEDYYSYIKKEDFSSAFSLLYRKDGTPFSDQFLKKGFSINKLLSFKIIETRELSKNLYEVKILVEAQKIGEKSITDYEKSIVNYVANIDSTYYLILNKIDIPSELYVFPDDGMIIIEPIS